MLSVLYVLDAYHPFVCHMGGSVKNKVRIRTFLPQ